MPELLDQYARPITQKPAAPRPGMAVRLTQEDRGYSEQTTSFTPSRVAQVLSTANQGDPRDQAKLCQEIREKDWDIDQAIATRAAAVKGTPWEIVPADDTAKAKQVAEFCEQALNHISWNLDADCTIHDQMIGDMLAASYLPGYSIHEIIWGQGGATIDGFRFIDSHFFTFGQDGGRRPLLVTTTSPQGEELAPWKYAVHYHRHRPGDPTRGGMIRPLAWIYAFKNMSFKDMLRFVEKYGLPFVAAFLSQTQFERDGGKIAAMLKNFGSDGAGVFTEGTRLEFVRPEAAGQGADLYLKINDMLIKGINKIILGQTSTSDSTDSNRSTASVHDNVRQDLREDDCRAVELTTRRAILYPLTVFNFGPDTPIPGIKYQCQPPEDLELESKVIVNLSNAGWRVTQADIQEKFGYTVEPSAPSANQDTVTLRALDHQDTLACAALESAPAMAASETLSDIALSEFLSGAGLTEWFGPVQMAIASALRGDPTEEQFAERCKLLLSSLDDLYDRMDTARFEQLLSQVIYTSTAQGIAQKARQLAARDNA